MEIRKRRIEDLSPPVEGRRNVVDFGNGIRFAKTISTKFICPKCRIFCGELVPIIDSRVREWLRKSGKTIMSSHEVQARVYCFNGCHESESWGWVNFDWNDKRQKDAVVFPRQWKNKDMLEWERKGRNANEEYRRRNGR